MTSIDFSVFCTFRAYFKTLMLISTTQNVPSCKGAVGHTVIYLLIRKEKVIFHV